MTENSLQSNCPVCNEPVKPAWRICPACETRLQAPACPLCGTDVKENWWRCPECEALLICRECGKRLSAGETTCSRCVSAETVNQDLEPAFLDTVCGLDLVLVKGGTFQMGDTLEQGSDTEQPVHEVVLDDFYITRFPITQDQWTVLMDDNPSSFMNPEHPVEQVTWSEAGNFARKLTRTAPENAVYTLPTEAQWEYAARSGGRDDLYAGGDDIESVAWYDENSNGCTHPVGHKKPNGSGLYDMSGNVWEWCLDTYQEDAYTRHGGANPVVKLSGPDRVIRGGSWNLDAWSARCARRFNFRADFMGPALGFRLVMLPCNVK